MRHVKALAIVALALLFAAHTHAACPAPQRMVQQKCTDPSYMSTSINFATPTTGTAVLTFVPSTQTRTTQPTHATTMILDAARADKLVLQITSAGTSADLWVVIREDGVFHSEVNILANIDAPIVCLAQGGGEGRGRWEINIVNWGATGVSWSNSIITSVELSCVDASVFRPESNPSFMQCGPKICEDGLHLMYGTQCAEASFAPLGSKLLLQESGSTSAIKKYVGGAGGLYPLADRKYLSHSFSTTYQSQTFKITVDPDTESEAPHLWVQVYEAGNTFVDEFATVAGATKSYTSKIVSRPGEWMIRIANFATDGSQQIVRPTRFKVEQFCAGGADFYDQVTDITSWKKACMPANFPDALGECRGMGVNWQNKGCTQPIINTAPEYQLEVEADTTRTSSTMKYFVGKSDLSKEIAPKESLIVELDNIHSSRITAGLVNQNGAMPADLKVHVYYTLQGAWGQADQPTPAGIPKVYQMYPSGQESDQSYGKWRILVVNWGAAAVTIPFKWLTLQYHCQGGSFTDQGDDIMACANVQCPLGEIKFTNANGGVECVAVEQVGEFDVTFTAGQTGNKMLFTGKTGSIILQPRTSVVHEFKMRSEMMLVTMQADGSNPDLWVKFLVDGELVLWPREKKPDGREDNVQSISQDAAIKGVFKIEVTNRGSTAQVFKPENIQGALQCHQETDVFEQSWGGVEACFKRCPLGTLWTYTGGVWACASVSSIGAVPVTISNPNAAARLITSKPVFVEIPAMSSVAFTGADLRSSRFDLTVPFADLETFLFSSAFLIVYEGDTAVDQITINSNTKKSVVKSYSSTATDANKGKWRVEFSYFKEHPNPIFWLPLGTTGKYYCDVGDFKSDGGQLESCIPLPCADPTKHRRSDNECYAVDLATNPVELKLAPVTAPASQKKFKGSSAAPMTLPPGTAVQVFDLKAFRADTLKLTIAKPASPLVFVQVFENGKFVEEFSPVGEEKVFKAKATTTGGQSLKTFGYRSGQALASSRGLWAVAVVNQGLAGEGDQVFTPSSMSVSLSCEAGTNFDGANVNTCIVGSSPPPPALYCAYTETLGFNPWERWNLFTLDGPLSLVGSQVEGRIAAKGNVDASNGAKVHMQKESFITKQTDNANGGPWSISSGGQVVLVGAQTVVSNGGIEAVGTIDKGLASFTGSSDATKTGLGDVLAAASDYFGDRSTTWGELKDSWIDFTKGASVWNVQLHGKVNSVEEVSMADLATLEKIALIGHPLGTLIINVKGAGKLVLKPTLQVTYEKQASQNGPEAPTFGRVILNIIDATEVEFAAGAASTPLYLSILAPKAAVTLSTDAPEIKGNVVAKSLTAHSNIATQPFGTFARRLAAPTGPPPPARAWTTTGKTKTVCLWHAL